jgi:hypothetical protein
MQSAAHRSFTVVTLVLIRRRGALGRYGFGYRRRSEVLPLAAAALERRLGPARMPA